jgi:hypothetical protein
MPSARFEPATPATKRPQTYALDRAATEVGSQITKKSNCWRMKDISRRVRELYESWSEVQCSPGVGNPRL